MPPLIIDQANAFKRALLAQEEQQMRQMANRWVVLERALSDQIDAMIADLERMQRSGQTVALWRVRRIERYQLLMHQIREQLSGYTDYAESFITAQQRINGSLGISHAMASIQAAGIQTPFDALPIEAIEFMVGTTGDGSPLRALLTEGWGPAADGLTDALIQGVTQGKNPREVARMMRQGLSTGLNRMMTIARTEQLRVYREASRQQYRESGVVEGYRRLSARDTRVCAACLMDDGTFYPLDVVMPEHPNGRCAMVPVVEGFPQPQWQTGRDWFMKQSPDDQEVILKPGRYEAWRNGEFDLDAIVTIVPNDTWGDSIGPTPIRELVPEEA